MLEAGIYLNLFKVNLESQPTEFMVATRNSTPKLKELRSELSKQKTDARIYAAGDTIFGYGLDKEKLAHFGFRTEYVDAITIPQLASRLIIEGYTDSLVSAGYTLSWSYGRAIVYQLDNPLIESKHGVKLIRGFDLHSLYLLNPENDRLTYGIVIDGVFSYRDIDNKPIHPSELSTRFGRELLITFRTRQGDLAPRGGINLEVARQRLTELILPFVQARHSFVLPTGIPAEIEQHPMRVVLAGDE